MPNKFTKQLNQVRPSKKTLLLFVAFSILVGADYLLHEKLAAFIQIQMVKQIKANKVNLKFYSVDYGYFPPNVTLTEVSYKDPLIIASAKSINLSASILPLLRGQLKAGDLTISRLNASITVSKEQDKKLNPKPELSLQKISDLIPLEKIYLSNSKLILLNKRDIYSLNFDFLELEKKSGKLQLETKSVVDIKTKDLKENFFLNSKLRWQDKGVFINFFTLQKKNSILQLSGFVKDGMLKAKNFDVTTLYNNITEMRLSVNTDLSEFNSLLLKNFPPHILKKSLVKKFEGRLQASGYYFPGALNSEQTSTEKSSIKIKADNLVTPLISIQGADFKGEVSKDSISGEKLLLSFNDKSSLDLKNLKLKKTSGSYLVSVDLSTERVQIEDIIESLNLSADSIKVPVSLSSHCGGSLHKKILIKCEGHGEVLSFDILNTKDRSKLISTKNITSKFKTTIKKDRLSFESSLSYKDRISDLTTKGSASGDVHFKRGFDVDFETSPLDLNFVNTISGLKFSGQTSLKGSAQGSSRWGTFQASSASTNFQLNEFYLGSNSSNLSYKFPNLSVNNIKGQVLDFENLYSGDFNLNVKKSKMTMDFLGQNVDARGLKAVFADAFQLPDDVDFRSNFILQANGSSNIDLLNLDLKAKMTQLDLFGEKFNEGLIEIAGLEGHWDVKKAALKKETATITGSGGFKGLKKIDTTLVSTGLLFQDSTFLKKLGVQFSGPVDITLKAKGALTGPKTTGTLKATNTLGPHKNSLGVSNLSYRLFDDELSFKGALFNRSFLGEGIYPLKPKGTLSIKGRFNKFDLLNFLNFNTGNSTNTSLLISGESDFTKSQENKSRFVGFVKNLKARLVSNNQNLLNVSQVGNEKLSSPLVFKTLQEEDESSFNLDLSKKNQQKISYEGSLDLAFLQPLIPTCEFIDGKFVSEGLSWTSKGSTVTSEGLGFINNASFKTDKFPYSFSKISTELKASGETLKIKSLSSFLANTKVFANGHIKTRLPTALNLNVHYKDLSVEFPKKIFTTSRANLNLAGSAFPLLIKGKLIVSEGLFSSDFVSSDGSQTVTPNKRLPTKILRKASPPADLKNIKITIEDKMKVATNEAEGFVSGVLVANGNPIDPVVKGSLKLKPGLRLNFQDNTFVVNEGAVNYKSKALNEPEVFIDATTQIKDNNDPLEKIYAVRMLAQGSPEDPEVDFSSQPSLEDKQIVSLLTIGTVSTQSLGQEINAQEQATFSGFQFGSYLLQRNKAIKDLKKQTGIEIGVSSSLTSLGVNPKVEAKKAWTPKFSTSISQTFGDQRNLEFKNEYKLNKKTSSILGVQNNQINNSTQLNNRRVRQNLILDLGLQYKFEFE